MLFGLAEETTTISPLLVLPSPPPNDHPDEVDVKDTPPELPPFVVVVPTLPPPPPLLLLLLPKENQSLGGLVGVGMVDVLVDAVAVAEEKEAEEVGGLIPLPPPVHLHAAMASAVARAMAGLISTAMDLATASAAPTPFSDTLACAFEAADANAVSTAEALLRALFDPHDSEIALE